VIEQKRDEIDILHGGVEGYLELSKNIPIKFLPIFEEDGLKKQKLGKGKGC
jgi:hypothetical protein